MKRKLLLNVRGCVVYDMLAVPPEAKEWPFVAVPVDSFPACGEDSCH
jgi:hypothetical protein